MICTIDTAVPSGSVITALRPTPAISSIVPVAIPRGDLREGGFQVVDNECQDAVASTLRISQ